MALTDREVRAASPREKSHKLADGLGLHLLVTPAGSKLWRFKYRLAGREKQLAFGAYPEVSLREARDRRDEARAALRAGRDPSREKHLSRHMAALAVTQSFEALGRTWHGQQKPLWTERHADDVLGSLERLVFPTIGQMHVNSVTPPLALAVLREVEENHGGETAHRVRQRMSAVFVFAIASGIGQTDPAAIVRAALRPVVRGRMPAVTTLAETRQVIAAVEAIPAHPVTRAAHRFLALTLVRPGEVHGARWDEFDLEGDQPVWSIPAERMKMKELHLVPLSRQAVAVLEAVRPFTGKYPLPFPNARFAHRPMSENALGYLLQRAGYSGRHVPHGWRATFSTVMNEMFAVDSDVIERILAHVPENKVRAAYNRAAYLDRRRELLQIWADMLLVGAQDVASVLLSPRRAAGVHPPGVQPQLTVASLSAAPRFAVPGAG
jgi:integrase